MKLTVATVKQSTLKNLNSLENPVKNCGYENKTGRNRLQLFLRSEKMLLIGKAG